MDGFIRRGFCPLRGIDFGGENGAVDERSQVLNVENLMAPGLQSCNFLHIPDNHSNQKSSLRP